jgi:hypothetical protein
MNAEHGAASGNMATARLTPTSPIPFDVLVRLLTEYTIRLQSVSQQMRVRTDALRAGGKDRELVSLQQTMSDLDYLRSQTRRVIDKASAYHEFFTKDEGEKLELELRLFDAESALRYASSVYELASRF